MNIETTKLLCFISNYCHLQLSDGKDPDWRSKWQRTAGAYWPQAEPNQLTTSQPDIHRSTDDASERINEAYFDSYGFFGIHREMIADKVTFSLPTTHSLHCESPPASGPDSFCCAMTLTLLIVEERDSLMSAGFHAR